MEEILSDTGISHAIIRPTLAFGDGDLLLNNMARALRCFPVFPVFGNGDYLVKPIYAEDLAGRAVAVGSRNDSLVAETAGQIRSPSRSCCVCWLRRWGARVRLVHTPRPWGLG